jgi:hypothetical protein
MTKTFPLRTVLTVTTGRLLTKRKAADDNGIGDLYELLDWLTGDANFTHQLGRAAEECKPWLFKTHPELAAISNEVALRSLDKWRDADKTGGIEEALKMWLTECKMMFPAIKDEYEFEQGCCSADHQRKHPVAELLERGVAPEKVAVVAA